MLLAILIAALICFNLPDVPEDGKAPAEDQRGLETTPEMDGSADAGISSIRETETEMSDGVKAAMIIGDEASTEKETETEMTGSALAGAEVGQPPEDFTCTAFDGSTFRLFDCRGRIVFINQWATCCTPCVNELPFFEPLKEEHPEIVVLAVHNAFEAASKDADYVQEMGWSAWKILFTLDTEESQIIEKIRGDNTMPRTVVLNRKGEVIFNEQRSVTLDGCKELLRMAEES